MLILLCIFNSKLCLYKSLNSPVIVIWVFNNIFQEISVTKFLLWLAVISPYKDLLQIQ